MTPTLRRRTALFLVGAIALARVAFAQPEEVPAPVDAVRAGEQYAIGPSSEPLISEMLGRGEALPGGCAFASGQIERTFVLATYTCGADQIELRLLHPESAPPGSVHTKAFAIAVVAGTPPAELIEAIADRVRAREATFEWTSVGGRDPYPSWGIGTVTAVAVTILVVVLVLVAAKRRRSRGGRTAGG